MEWRFIRPQALVAATSPYQVNDKRTYSAIVSRTLARYGHEGARQETVEVDVDDAQLYV